MLGVISYGLGSLIGFALLAFLVIVFIQDITQKKHTVLRNFPVIGHLRYFFEKQGEYFRQYFFMNDREELPFNRATRGWVYRLAKAEGGVIGFGSTNNTNEPGSILFVNHPYPVLEEDRLPTPPLAIGADFCEKPFLARSVVHISGISFRSISAPPLPPPPPGADRAHPARWCRQRRAAARQEGSGPRPFRQAGGREDRGRRLAVHQRAL